MSTFSRLSVAMLITAMLFTASCGSSNSGNNSISAFEPEVINAADAFQFQITDAADVTTMLEYQWTNTGTQATVDHSTLTLEGAASVTLFDADSVRVYNSALAASANEQSNTGATGVWVVRVTLLNYSGTANFRIEKL